MSFISKSKLFRARALMAYGLAMMIVGIFFAGLAPPVALVAIGILFLAFGYMLLRTEEVIAKPYPGESSD